MSLAQYRPLGFGEILDAAFSLYRRNFFTFFLTALLPAIPMSLASGALVFQTMEDPQATPGLTFLGAMLATMLGLLIQWGALARHFSQAYTGQPVSLGDGFRAGLRAFFPLLVVGVLAYVGLVAVLMVIMVPIAIALVFTGVAAGPGQLGPAEIAGFGLGGLLAVIAMLLVVSSLFAVAPAVVVERCGPFAAMARSFRLARGALLRITGIVVVGWIIAILPVIAGAALTGGLTQMATGQPPASTTAFFFQQVFGLLGSSLTTPFWVGSLVMAYYDRRVRTEAFDLQLAVDTLAPA